jgi:hypothetical protein
MGKFAKGGLSTINHNKRKKKLKKKEKKREKLGMLLKNSIGSNLRSNLMCSKDCNSKNLQCRPTLEKLELLMNIFNNRSKNPI